MHKYGERTGMHRKTLGTKHSVTKSRPLGLGIGTQRTLGWSECEPQRTM